MISISSTATPATIREKHPGSDSTPHNDEPKKTFSTSQDNKMSSTSRTNKETSNRVLDRLSNCLLLAGVEQIPAVDVSYFVVSFRIMRMLPQSLLLAMFPYGISPEQSSLTIHDVAQLCECNGNSEIKIISELETFLSHRDRLLSLRRQRQVSMSKHGNNSRNTRVAPTESSALSWQKRFNSFVGDEELDVLAEENDNISTDSSSYSTSTSSSSSEDEGESINGQDGIDLNKASHRPLKGFLDTLWYEVVSPDTIPTAIKQKAVQVAVPRNLVRFLCVSLRNGIRRSLKKTLDLIKPGSSITLTKDMDSELSASLLFDTFPLSIPPLQPLFSSLSLILHETIDIYFLTQLGTKSSTESKQQHLHRKKSSSDTTQSLPNPNMNTAHESESSALNCKKRLRDDIVRSVCMKWIIRSLNHIVPHSYPSSKNEHLNCFVPLLKEFTQLDSKSEWHYHGMRPYTIQLDRYAVLPLQAVTKLSHENARQKNQSHEAKVISVEPISTDSSHPEIVTQVSRSDFETTSSSQSAMRENLETRQPFRFCWMESCQVPRDASVQRPAPTHQQTSSSSLPVTSPHRSKETSSSHYKIWLRRSWTVEFTTNG